MQLIKKLLKEMIQIKIAQIKEIEDAEKKNTRCQ